MFFKKSVLVFLFISSSICIYFISDYAKEIQNQKYQDRIYQNVKKDILFKFDAIYSKLYYSTTKISDDLQTSLNITNQIIKNKVAQIEYINSNDRYLNIYDPDANFIFSNMQSEYIPNNKDQYINHYIKNPQKTIDIVQTQSGLTIDNFIPLYYDKIIGYMQTKIQFDEVVSKLDKENIKAIILLNDTDSNRININLSHSRQFLDNRYVVNKNADKYYMKILEDSKLYKSHLKDEYINKKTGIVIIKHSLESSLNKNIAEIFLIKSSDNLNFDDETLINSLINYIGIILVLFIGLIISYINDRIINVQNAKQNEKLLHENQKLKVLSDKLDYNEKKLSNLFNLQPNIMFISNGREIVQVNKRFMGFFRRYKTFENFKQKHRSISELFEQCDKPNYIFEEIIDGKNWLEFILSHPKQLYKTIMSVDDEQHHFMIKVNEMEYMRNFNERYIVVAFVDITQELINKQSEVISEINNEFDLSYIVENNITYSIHEFTALLPTKQAIFKAHSNDINNEQYLLLDINFSSKDKELNWKFILPIEVISYMYNVITSNYDAILTQKINKDIKETAFNLINNICLNFVSEVSSLKQDKLLGLNYKSGKIITIKKEDIDIKNLYKFTMFLENQEISIFIDFDQNSFLYTKQIHMLGMVDL